jgi:hypothetical protein
MPAKKPAMRRTSSQAFATFAAAARRTLLVAGVVVLDL